MRVIRMKSVLLVVVLALGASALEEALQARYQPEYYNPISNVVSGCSAALKCTPMDHCTAAGIISVETVNISAEKRLYSAPLIDCKLDNGNVGKCCRDPNYTDPWPADQIGKWIPGAFGNDGQYSTGKTIQEVLLTTPKPVAIKQKVEFGLGGIKQEGQGGLLQQGGGAIAQVAEGQKIQQVQVGVGQYEIPGEVKQIVKPGQTIVVQQGGGQIVQPGQLNYQVVQGQGQYLQGGFGQFGIGGFGTALQQSIYRIFLQPYTAGAQCGLMSSLPPFGNHAESEADFAQYPWQAMVLEQDGEEKSLRCGGVITRPDVVLTSAACVDGLAPEKVLIKGGEWKLAVDEEPLPFQISKVKHILYHPFYQSGSYQYDVAILVLAENLRFNQNIYPICMPSVEDSFEALYGGAGFGAAFGAGYATAYGQCLVTGWGKEVLQAHRTGAIMHDLNVTLIRPNECQSRINKYYPELEKYFNKESSVCAEPANPLNNICSVDIGSALACPNKDGHYVLRAIYSWDSGCKQLGNQLGAFYKFDIEWYLWAIGLLENDRFAKFNINALLAGAEGKVKVQGEGLEVKQEGLGLGQFGAGLLVGQPQVISYTTKPQIITYTTKPEIITYTTKPKIITYTTKPEIITYTTKPKIITYTTKPEIITYTTKPKIVTYTTKPEILTYTTKPEIISYTTKPQVFTYGVEPQISGLPVELSEGSLAEK